jgi:hypothetical protein
MTGHVNADRLTDSMFKTSLNIQITVLIGIRGDIPPQKRSQDSLGDVYLRDVVVGWLGVNSPACL